MSSAINLDRNRVSYVPVVVFRSTQLKFEFLLTSLMQLNMQREMKLSFWFPLRGIGEGILIYLMVFLLNYPSKFAIHIVGLVGNFFTLGSTLSTPSILNVDLYLLASALSVHSLVVPINIGHHALWHVHLRFRTLIRLQYTVEVGSRAFNVNDKFSTWPNQGFMMTNLSNVYLAL